MSVTPTAALRAYQNLADLDVGRGAAANGGVKTEEGGFARVLSAALGSAVEKGRAAEAGAAAVVAGKADMVDVVTAVAETEAAMETLVTLRNKVISAYEEIMRMPI